MAHKLYNKKNIINLFISVLLIIFGIGEINVVLFYDQKPIILSNIDLTDICAIVLGCLYILAGFFLFSKKRINSIISLYFLIGNIILRILMLVMNLYPTITTFEKIGFIIGISLAVLFSIFVIFKIKQNIKK